MHAHDMAFVFGLLGNIVSFLVFLAPLPTFCRIYTKKSTEGFQSIPYSVALFSSMLYLYYAFLKTNSILVITINSVGFVIESIYLAMYLIYAPKKAKVYTVKLVLLLNIGAYGLIILFTFLLSHGSLRLKVVGWICAAFSVAVFAAPLSIMRLVIKTKSVEYMPFWLSFFLTLCAIMWFCYGFLLDDFFIATPNVLGFTFGIVQMILYTIYKNRKQPIMPEPKQDEPIKDVSVCVIEAQENSTIDALKKNEEQEKNEGIQNASPEPKELNV